MVISDKKQSLDVAVIHGSGRVNLKIFYKEKVCIVMKLLIRFNEHAKFIAYFYRNIKLKLRLLITLLILSVVFPTAAFGLNADIVFGKKEILLNNKDVEVVRVTYPPGTESGFHTHQYPNRVVYFIKGGELMLIAKDGNIQPKTLMAKEGQTLYLPAITHNVKNVGNTEVIILETEIK